jgi:hypothetical protein
MLYGFVVMQARGVGRSGRVVEAVAGVVLAGLGLRLVVER